MIHSLLFSILLIASSGLSAYQPPAELFSPFIPLKILATFTTLPQPLGSKYPQYTDHAGAWQYLPPDVWTSGFLPVSAYALNARRVMCRATPANALGIADWLGLARAATAGLVPVGNEQRLSFAFVEELKVDAANETAREVVLKLARNLADRFSPVVGATRSGDSSDPTSFPVIIDSVMNLELLFHGETLSGDASFRKIAIAHADTAMANHIRDDGSTWHIVEYNATTGAVITKRTSQGYSSSSTWSRGQAWSIYGFANLWKLTGDRRYLDAARRLAEYFLKNLPSGGLVPWDFDAPAIPTRRTDDSSAATIAANALLLLAQHEKSSGAAQMYTDAAIGLLVNITRLAWRPSWESLLANGTVTLTLEVVEIDDAYIGDYYFIKAGNELLARGLAKCN
ncbi:hypothetical protein H0H81_000653 [Sphagnurus paluster]|uniref:Uncharacterized protein n=1 Tax=Sphagnurus paluster TaxID=117069 RepID=A0A9P7K719_9AGAR|nr:hypothetical protein H0H81_000653 [Sphagnurus paluster]